MDTNVNFRTTSELNEQATNVLNRLGLDMSTAINMFLIQIVDKNTIPFTIKSHEQNFSSIGDNNIGFGCMHGKIHIAADFDDPIEGMEDYY